MKVRRRMRLSSGFSGIPKGECGFGNQAGGSSGQVELITYLVISIKNIWGTFLFRRRFCYARIMLNAEQLMTEQAPLNTSPLPVKLRIEDYLLLDRSGAFDAYAKTELIEGEIFFMNAQHRAHALAKMELYDSLRDRLRAISSALRPLVEVSIAISEVSAPEPDIVLTSEPAGDGLVPLASVVLIVEVADTTLKNDLGRKAALYARHGVPEYWVADLSAKVLHQMWAPVGEIYGERREVRFGESIAAAMIDGLTVETKDL
jgi:Uma2 family endonuclease